MAQDVPHLAHAVHVDRHLARLQVPAGRRDRRDPLRAPQAHPLPGPAHQLHEQVPRRQGVLLVRRERAGLPLPAARPARGHQVQDEGDPQAHGRELQVPDAREVHARERVGAVLDGAARRRRPAPTARASRRSSRCSSARRARPRRGQRHARGEHRELLLAPPELPHRVRRAARVPPHRAAPLVVARAVHPVALLVGPRQGGAGARAAHDDGQGEGVPRGQAAHLPQGAEGRGGDRRGGQRQAGHDRVCV